MTGPLFDDLMDDDVTGEERERLLRAHELLLRAGPPPELPPSLQQPAAPPKGQVHFLPRRRRLTLALIAAAIAIAAFGAGYAVHKPAESFSSKFAPIPMKGTEAAPAALASIEFAKKDAAGNWPMQIKEHGLKSLPKGAYYEMWATKNGKPVGLCGTFTVSGDETTVEMNMPFSSDQYNGWIVTEHVPGETTNQTLLTT
jgi:hypothetical protein